MYCSRCLVQFKLIYQLKSVLLQMSLNCFHFEILVSVYQPKKNIQLENSKLEQCHPDGTAKPVNSGVLCTGVVRVT